MFDGLYVLSTQVRVWPYTWLHDAVANQVDLINHI